MLFAVGEAGELRRKADGERLPDGAYTTFRTYGQDRILLLYKHIQRLNESVRLQGQVADLSPNRVARGVQGAIATAAFPESRLRLTFAPPSLFIEVWPFEPLPQQLYESGVPCVTLPLRRTNPQAKDTRFQEAAVEAYARLPAGVHEGLMWDPADGALLEGLSSNFFAVLSGELRTEGTRVLSGVTRSLVLDLAGELLPVRLEAVRRSDLPSVREAFLTSVSRGVLPVSSLDGESLGDGRPGPITRELMQRLADFAGRYATAPQAS